MTRLEEIEARKMEIREEVEKTEEVEKIEELTNEVEALNEEVEQINEQTKEEEIAEELEQKSFMAKEVIKEERKIMDNKELRNSKEYVKAYAEYVKTGDEKELRALLTTNTTNEGNMVEVPDFIYDVVKTAWEKENLLQFVRNISVKGNLKVQFEVEGDEAEIHTEGGEAVTEEDLVLGVVTLTPVSIKKWISISDEVYDMRGEEFLRYIYDEITYRIAKKVADTLVGKIAALPQTLTPNEDGVYDEVSAAKINAVPALGLVAQAVANLSDEATNPIIVMNKLTYAAFKEIQYQGNFSVDPFEGLKVVFNNTLPAYADEMTADKVYMIVGDFYQGALINNINGNGIELKFDDKTLMTADLIRILGRRYVGVEAVADRAFTLIASPTTSA